MVIYEGKDIVLHYIEGDTDYIVITFADTFPHIAHERFYAQSVMEKKKISAIGFASKLESWYHSPEMEVANKLCNDITQKYKKRILIGASKGSYGALKHSVNLNADAVFVMGPRFYINPTEGQAIISLFHEYIEFIKTMAGVSIDKEEIGGKVYVDYDPYDLKDRYQYECIKRVYPSTITLYSYFTGHIVAGSLSGTENFSRIIEALASGNTNKVLQVVSHVRRHHINNFLKIFELPQAYTRHPLLMYRILISEKFKKIPYYERIFDSENLILRVCHHLISKNYKSEATSLFNFYIKNYTIPKRFDLKGESFTISNIVSLPYLLSAHGHYLCYNASSKNLVNCHFFNGNIADIPLRIYQHNNFCKLIGIWNEIWIELIYKSEKITFRPLSNQTDTNIEIISHGNMITLKTPEGFVTAEPNMKVRIDTSKVLGWEVFAPISLS